MATKPVQKKVNPLASAIVPDIEASNRFNVGGGILPTLQLMSALGGTPTAMPGVPMGTAIAPAPNMTGVPTGTAVPIAPGDIGQQAAGTIVPQAAVNIPAATLTPSSATPASTIMGMPPEQFAALAGMLGSALAPNEFGPTGQLVPSRMSKLGELGGSWGLAQMLAKKSSAPRTTIPRTGGE